MDVLLFKCLTTQAVHIELLNYMDSDAFLMALRRFIGRHGQPAELYSDQGTNFRGGETELREAFSKLSPNLQQLLAKQKDQVPLINPLINPPAAITSNCLQMGRPDGSLPQVVFPESELFTKQRWRHSQVLADRF